MSAEANQVGAASSDGNVLVQIAQGLATKPAFLLSFGIFTASLVYTVALLSQKAPLVYIEFTGILTAVALVVSLVAMRFDVRPDSTTGDREVDACLADIQDGLTSALKSSQSIFRDQITARIADLRSEAANWKGKQLHTVGSAYESILPEIYRSAKSEVFCTSVHEYLSTWNLALGKRLLEAHQKNDRAEVCRIFIFRTRGDLDRAALEVIDKHVACRVNVRVFFIDENPDIEPADFTYVDAGEAIAQTVQFGEKLGAIWYFDNNANGGKFRILRDRIKSASLRLQDLHR